MADDFLPYGRQAIDEADIDAVSRVLRSDFLTTGPAVAGFEAAFATATGAVHAISCSSGTAALHLAAMALNIGEGDTVIVPSLTFLATANAARLVGAEVEFADVDPDTGLMTPETLDEALAGSEGRAKAVFPVHLNGQCCDMTAIRKITDEHGLKVVEDACHALGGAGVGGCKESDVATFSLHPVKTIAAGEGGVVTTNNDAVAAKVTRLRNHGMVREPDAFTNSAEALDAGGAVNPWYYEMAEPGFNYRLSDIHAALAVSQLAKLKDFAARRRALAAQYDAALAALAPAIRPVGRAAGQDPVWHLYAVLIDFDALAMSRAQVMAQLREQGIGTQVHYLPLHRQPYYRDRYGAHDFPGADSYYARVLSLPLYPSMSDGDVDRVVEALTAIVERRRQ